MEKQKNWNFNKEGAIKYDLYCRVSSEDQNVEQQMKHVKTWCRKNNIYIASSTMDMESGTLPLTERKQFLKVLNNPQGSAMLIYNLDRLTRNWEDSVFIENHFNSNWDNYKLISLSDSIDLTNAAGRMMFRIRMATICFMPEDMKEKQVIGIARAKAEGGKYLGRKKGSLNK